MDVLGDRVSNHFISSFIASFGKIFSLPDCFPLKKPFLIVMISGSAVASNPIDVIRTRLMNQKRVSKGLAFAGVNATTATVTPTQRIYNGSIDCAVQTVRNEGFRALYKGFIPTYLRMGPWNIIFFITYEQLKQFY